MCEFHIFIYMERERRRDGAGAEKGEGEGESHELQREGETVRESDSSRRCSIAHWLRSVRNNGRRRAENNREKSERVLRIARRGSGLGEPRGQ